MRYTVPAELLYDDGNSVDVPTGIDTLELGIVSDWLSVWTAVVGLAELCVVDGADAVVGPGVADGETVTVAVAWDSAVLSPGTEREQTEQEQQEDRQRDAADQPVVHHERGHG